MCTYNSITYICVRTTLLHTYVYIQLYYIHMCTYNSTTYICVHNNMHIVHTNSTTYMYICVHTAPLHAYTYVYIIALYIHICTYTCHYIMPTVYNISIATYCRTGIVCGHNFFYFPSLRSTTKILFAKIVIITLLWKI